MFWRRHFDRNGYAQPITGRARLESIRETETRCARRCRGHCQRLLIGLTILVVGILLPDFHPHPLHETLCEITKGAGCAPILRVLGDLLGLET